MTVIYLRLELITTSLRSFKMVEQRSRICWVLKRLQIWLPSILKSIGRLILFTLVEVKSCGDECILLNGLGKKNPVRLPLLLDESSCGKSTEAIEATIEVLLEVGEVANGGVEAGAEVFFI